MAWTTHRVHKWLAITTSLFLLLWVTTGIAMILPQPSTLPVGSLPRGPTNYRDVTVSPAQAVEVALREVGGVAQVTAVTLKRLVDDIVYVVELRPGGQRLIDARRGSLITVDAQAAERIAREGFPRGIPTQEIELLNQYTFNYPAGPLPAYRVTFGDPAATITDVAVGDGSSRRGNRWTRVRTAFISFHEFSPFRAVIKSAVWRRQLMLWLSVVLVAVIVTGWYMALPRRRGSRA